QVKAVRHLRITLVGAIAEAEPTTDLFCRIKDVEVHRLVVVARRFGFVRVLILGLEPDPELRRCLSHRAFLCRPYPQPRPPSAVRHRNCAKSVISTMIPTTRNCRLPPRKPLGRDHACPGITEIFSTQSHRSFRPTRRHSFMADASSAGARPPSAATTSRR